MMNWHDFGERRNGFFLLRYPLLEPHLLLSSMCLLFSFTIFFGNIFWERRWTGAYTNLGQC